MVLWPGSMWCMTSAQVAPGALPSFTSRDWKIPKRQWSEPTVWSWTADASEWIIPSPNVLTPRHQGSTWVDQLIMEEVEEVVVAVAAAAAAAGGEETLTMIVAMTAMTDMMSVIIDTAAGARHHPTTVDTGLAPGLVPIAHDDTKITVLSFAPVFDGV